MFRSGPELSSVGAEDNATQYGLQMPKETTDWHAASWSLLTHQILSAARV